MRYDVRSQDAPHNVIGTVEGPEPDQLVQQGFKHSFVLSRHPFGHPRHYFDVSNRHQALEIAKFGDSRSNKIFMAFVCPQHLTQSDLRHIVGFRPMTVLVAAPASTGSDGVPKRS